MPPALSSAIYLASGFRPGSPGDRPAQQQMYACRFEPIDRLRRMPWCLNTVFARSWTSCSGLPEQQGSHPEAMCTDFSGVPNEQIAAQGLPPRFNR